MNLERLMVKNDLENLFELIERQKLTGAKDLVNKLKEYTQTDPDLIKAEGEYCEWSL